MILPSRRNLVRTVEFSGRTAVRKLFDSPEDWQKETRILRRLKDSSAAPRILAAVPGVLLMEYLPFPTLLDELNRQERDGFSAVPWLALRSIVHNLHTLAGLTPSDGNLRNFLWDGVNIHALDFEQYTPQPPSDALSQIAAFILEYHPRDTIVKQQAAKCLFDGNVDISRQALLERRRSKRTEAPDASFVLLAGGKSSRMGRDKASLPFFGTSLLEFQLDKARLLGCSDVLVSGSRLDIENARIIPDVFPDRGPLGGLHACLEAAAHSRCIVLGVDMPLLPVCELRALLREHMETHAEITLAMHGDRWEPLAGIYNSFLFERIAPLIEFSGAPVRALIQNSDSRFRCSTLPESFWTNCNTPDEWQRLFGI